MYMFTLRAQWSSPAEAMHDLQRARPHDDNEECREDAQYQREEHLGG